MTKSNVNWPGVLDQNHASYPRPAPLPTSRFAVVTPANGSTLEGPQVRSAWVIAQDSPNYYTPIHSWHDTREAADTVAAALGTVAPPRCIGSERSWSEIQEYYRRVPRYVSQFAQ